MTTPHKWADVIKAWADGKTIQFANRFTKGWVDWTEGRPNMQPQFNQDLWRVKPNTIKYRRFLTRDTNDHTQVYILHENENQSVAEANWGSYFLKWIDTEWQEIEV